MDAIETLMNEHRVIERVLDALVGFADEVSRRESTDKDELARFVQFVREFADGYHHGKEEDILFQAMVGHGFSREGGPIAVMLREHDQGRAFVGALRAKAEQAAPWSAEDRREIAAAARGFSDLLHAHIHKEDAVLYPMAEQHLPARALEQVQAACAGYDRDEASAGEHERLVALADALVLRHASQVHPAPRQRAAFGCAG